MSLAVAAANFSRAIRSNELPAMGGLSTTLHADGSIVDAQELVVVLNGQELGQGLQVRGVLLNQVLVQVIPRNLNHGL